MDLPGFDVAPVPWPRIRPPAPTAPRARRWLRAATRALIAITVLAVGGPAARAQETGAIHGRVVDALTSLPVAGATVSLEETHEIVFTDANGDFTFAPGRVTGHVAVVDPSYEPAGALASDGQDVAIALVPANLGGEEIVITAERERARSSAGQTTLRRDEIDKAAGSRGDALSAVKNLPGVANNPGFGPQAGIVIRGSSPNDSRIFVDGFEIPLLYHLGGIQSVLPTEMIDDLVYTPGAYGVEHGKASAGTIEVSSREGQQQLAGLAEVSFINAAVMVQGPLGRGGSFAIAARRSYIDALIPLVAPSSLSFTALPRYYDYQARLDYPLADRLRLTGFLFGSDDKFAIASTADNVSDPAASGRFNNTTRFTRAIVSAIYEQPGRYARLSVSALTQQLGVEIGSERYAHVDPDAAALRGDSRWQLHRGVALIAGAESEYRRVHVRLRMPRPPREGDPTPPSFTYDPLIELDSITKLSNSGLWSALELEPVRWLKASAGVRADYFSRNRALVVQPRLQTRFTLSDATAILAAGGLYTRPPDDRDENSQDDLQPERSWQSSAGVEHKLATGIALTATGYYNQRSDLIVQRTGDRSGAMTSDGSASYENAGVGRSYGAELMVQARRDRFFGWAAYTYARSERRDHPMEAMRLFDTDQTHNLIVLGSWKLGARGQWQLGARFQYTSGTPYTPVTGAIYESDRNNYRPEFGRVNSQRDPAQHQLDVRLDRAFTFATWKLSGYVDISNVYVNAPVVAHEYNLDYSERTATTGFPILPSLGVRGEF